jgi:hypothetical protein
MKSINFYLCLLAFVSTLNAYSQISFKGLVVDNSNEKPIREAAILLIPVDDSRRGNSLLKTITSDKGMFDISIPYPGKYRLKISAFGFSPFTEIIETKEKLADNSTEEKPEVYRISRGDIELEEAQVISRGAMLNGLDRKVYSVSDDLQVSSGTGTDILRQVPNVSLDIDGNVALRGDENVTILIDGRPAAMMGYRGQNAFDRLPSGTVERVEVIVNPGAKFDAQGTGGIINLVTKKGRELPFNGSLQVGVGTRDKYNFGGNISIPIGQVRINTNIGINDRNMLGGGATYRDYRLPDTSYSTQEISNSNREDLSYNAQFGVDWELKKKYIFGLSFGTSQRYRNSWDSAFFDNKSEDNSETSSAIQTTLNDSKDLDQNISIRFERKFEEETKKWTADFRLSNNNDNNLDESIIVRDVNYPVAFTYDGAYQENFLINGQGLRANFQTDIEWPISEKTKIDFGLRSNWRNTFEDQNARQFESINSNFSKYDSLRSFITDLKNQVHAGYITLGHAFSKKWKGQLGLRYEHAIIYIKTSDTSDIDRIIPGLFPSAYLTYSPKKGTNFQFSYSLRVNRPDGRWGGNLNPNIDYSNPSSLSKGNPKLNPELTHSIDFSAVQYGRWGSVSGSFYSKHTVNMMSRFIETLPDGVVMMSWENFNSRDNYGVSTNANIKLNKSIRMQISGDAFYSQINGRNVLSNLTRSGFGWQGRSNVMIQTSKNQQLQVSYSQWGAGPTGQGIRKGIHFFNAAYKMNLLNKRFSLSARISDIFNTRKFRYLQYTDRLDIDFMRYRESRIAWLTLQYNFGKMDPRSKGNYRSGSSGGSRDNMIGM